MTIYADTSSHHYSYCNYYYAASAVLRCAALCHAAVGLSAIGQVNMYVKHIHNVYTPI